MSDSLHIVCPHCDTVNRLPAAKVSIGGTCGRCKHDLLPAKPLALTRENFSRHISRNDLPVVVDFWASWCAPCRMMAPVVDQMAIEWNGKARFAKLDTEASPQIANQFSIRSIPTLIVFQNGKEVARQSGALDRSRFSQWLGQVLP